MRGQLTQEQVEQLLWSEIVGHIGFHVDECVRVAPVQYAYDGHSVYLYSAEGAMLSAMRRDPNVCFEVDQMSDLSNWRSVASVGTFKELGAEDAERARKLIVTRFAPLIKGEPPWPVNFTPKEGGPLEQQALHRSVYYRLCLSEKAGRFESWQPSSESRERDVVAE